MGMYESIIQHGISKGDENMSSDDAGKVGKQILTKARN